MKTVLAAAAALGAIALAAPAAAHYGGAQPIGLRQAQLEQRIDAGVRHGDLTRRQAARLRAELDEIVRLEAYYRRDGLSAWERADLESRLDWLSQRIRFERQYGDDAWRPISPRREQFAEAVEAGVRRGELTRREAARLWADFDELLALEARYRRNGLSHQERAELDWRFDRLGERLFFAGWRDQDRRRG